MPTPRSPRPDPRLLGTLLFVLGLCAAWSEPSAPGPLPGSGSPESVRYDRDIRPLLSARCFECHGPDEAKLRAKLRLDVGASAHAERGGIAALVAGDPEQSEAWLRITETDPEYRMPPADSGKQPFSEPELGLLRRWIEEGAEYEEHWSFVAAERPAVPAVRDTAWVRNEIDAFVLARLEAQGIAPSPEADPATLLRRVFLELTGLPPTPEELDAFELDTRADAYERWVERLLHEEPYVSRYAERAAIPWLDAARYADTSGIHMDAGRQIWPWRDWVLRALRDGMPFDQFLTEQLAGDLLPEATLDQRVASGFNRNHVTTDEGGAIDEEYLVEYAVDRAATTSSVFLGLTMGCARCHDHKYDPVSQQEFYQLYSFFNSNEEPGLYSQAPDAQRALEPFLDVPAPEFEAELAQLAADLERLQLEYAQPIPGEAEQLATFFDDRLASAGIAWADANVVAMESAGGATLELQDDGSVLASGANPDRDTHVLTLETEGGELRLLALEALEDPSLPAGKVGRADNGNAVLESIRAEAVSLLDPEQRRPVRFSWVWADVEQLNGDYRAVNALVDSELDQGLGWAVAAHQQDGPRAALFLADEPFGYEGGTRLEVTLDYDSRYARHTLGRVRLSLGHIAPEGLATLGTASSGWYATAPFSAPTDGDLYDTAYGPESMARLDTALEFGEHALRFNFVDVFLDERLNTELGGGPSVTFVAKRLFVPSARELELSLGSDDGFVLYLDGVEVARNRVDRGVAVDQDRATLSLTAGEHTAVFKIVNTGGPGGFYWRALRGADELSGALLAAALPASARTERLELELRDAWREEFSPSHREKRERVTAAQTALADASAGLPRTMVMQELDEPRQTFVLVRGEYDKPDETRPVSRAVPAALGRLPEGAPTDRLGLAQWMCAPDNPLVARVAVNRLWELCFGSGLVATSEDFGMRGEWPSHPQLLDWLALEYRESGWDTKALLARIVTSSTYRQSSRERPELQTSDPDERLLARYPRRRLEAELIRDQALYVAGILVEQLGGASVKPYQPEGLWREVAMPQSNTRTFERGSGDELWRRSLYTYWKRASPPPSMLTFDAPTREFCVIRRTETATPLQALVLWNDEQFVEAARVLAERTLTEDPEADDGVRLARMFERCTGRAPDEREAAALGAALTDFRARYAAAPEDAALLLEVGDKPTLGADSDTPGDLRAAELAAWTMIANTLFSLDSMISRA